MYYSSQSMARDAQYRNSGYVDRLQVNFYLRLLGSENVSVTEMLKIVGKLRHIWFHEERSQRVNASEFRSKNSTSSLSKARSFYSMRDVNMQIFLGISN